MWGLGTFPIKYTGTIYIYNIHNLDAVQSSMLEDYIVNVNQRAKRNFLTNNSIQVGWYQIVDTAKYKRDRRVRQRDRETYLEIF